MRSIPKGNFLCKPSKGLRFRNKMKFKPTNDDQCWALCKDLGRTSSPPKAPNGFLAGNQQSPYYNPYNVELTWQSSSDAKYYVVVYRDANESNPLRKWEYVEQVTIELH